MKKNPDASLVEYGNLEFLIIKPNPWTTGKPPDSPDYIHVSAAAALCLYMHVLYIQKPRQK